MPIQVQGPDGQLLEFPDGTSRDVMKAAMQKRYGGPSAPNPAVNPFAGYDKAAEGTGALPVKNRMDDPAFRQRVAEQQAKDKETYSSTRGESWLTNAMAGAGKSAMDSWRGLKQLGGIAADAIPGVDISDWRAGVDAGAAEARRIDAPLMDTTSGKVGNIAGATAQMAIPVGGWAGRAGAVFGKAAPYVGAAVRGAAFSGAQPVLGDEGRARNAAVGGLAGVVGQGIALGTGALARGAISRADPYTQQLAQKAQQVGIKLGVPNISENPLVRTMASQMERLPFSGAGRRATKNQHAFNAEVGRSIGDANAKRITPSVFADAKARIGGEFNRLTAQNDLHVNQQLVGDIRNVIDEARRLGGEDFGKVVSGWGEDLLSRVDASGAIPGKAYRMFDSKIGEVMAGGGDKSYFLGQLRDAVRGAYDSSISAGDRAAWQAARQQWANLKTIEPLVAKSANGNISPSLLMGRVTSDGAGKTRMAAGNGGALGGLARVGQRFLKESPNSGTADRLLVNGLLGGGLYGAQQTGLIDPSTATYLGLGLLANRSTLGALYSRGLTAGGSVPLTGLARLALAAPAAIPAVVSANERPPLEIDVVGGVPGPAPTRAEMAALRAEMDARARSNLPR